MPEARNRKDRIRQVKEWLRYHHPHSRSVKIRWVKRITDPKGGSDWYGYSVAPNEIVLSERACRTKSLAVETLLHEWAHLLRGQSHGYGHDDRYWSIFGRIYRDFFDGGGQKASREY